MFLACERDLKIDSEEPSTQLGSRDPTCLKKVKKKKKESIVIGTNKCIFSSEKAN
jgi:hypothetical protein